VVIAAVVMTSSSRINSLWLEKCEQWEGL
jgi:hypothetical protein